METLKLVYEELFISTTWNASYKDETTKDGKKLQPLSHPKGLCEKKQVKEKMRSQKRYFCKKKRGSCQTTNTTKMQCSEELETRYFKQGREFRSPTVLHRWERLYPTYCILISISVEVRCFQKMRYNLIIW